MLREKQPLMEMLICGRRHQIFSVILNPGSSKENQPNILSKLILHPLQLTQSINYSSTFHYLGNGKNGEERRLSAVSWKIL